jgi:hypothetical protein
MPQKAQSGNMSVAEVFLAEISELLPLLPFNFTPRFKVKWEILNALNPSPTISNHPTDVSATIPEIRRHRSLA